MERLIFYRLILVLACGIAALVGLFLPWMTGGWLLDFSMSGWDWISEAGIEDAHEAFIALVGGSMMIAFTFPALVIYLVNKKAKGEVRILGVLTAIAALAALVGCWLFVKTINDTPATDLGTGLFVSAAGSTLGMIFGLSVPLRV
ncbi:MAG TPA: hypothetical protein G4O13_05210 [Dehalococcoidia bacterium]|nr:hypothetical protein [Dehalococcoidia bacterium]